jgi:tetratricopeptide (TPR) repeat protein
MRKARLRSLALCCLSLLLLGGCSRIHDYDAVIRGNRYHSRGLYQEAAAAYLSVTQGGFGSVLRFDLANVYARLGEYPAAAELYAAVRKTGDPRLCAAAWYNEGILLYEKARYADAYRAFRAALVIEPDDSEARRNLELAWRDWQRRMAAQPERAAPAQRSGASGSDDQISLLRRLETGRFRPGSAAPAAPNPEDY